MIKTDQNYDINTKYKLYFVFILTENNLVKEVWIVLKFALVELDYGKRSFCKICQTLLDFDCKDLSWYEECD